MAPVHINPGYRSTVQQVYPLGAFNDATIAVRVGRRENTSSATSYTSSQSPGASGTINMKAGGRIHDFELTLSQASGTAWAHAQGLDVQSRVAGRK